MCTRGKCTCYLDIFSHASILSSLEATDLKFAECVNIFVQIGTAKKIIVRWIICVLGARKLKKKIFPRVISAVTLFHCSFIGQVPKCYHILSGILAITP